MLQLQRRKQKDIVQIDSKNNMAGVTERCPRCLVSILGVKDKAMVCEFFCWHDEWQRIRVQKEKKKKKKEEGIHLKYAAQMAWLWRFWKMYVSMYKYSSNYIVGDTYPRSQRMCMSQNENPTSICSCSTVIGDICLAKGAVDPYVSELQTGCSHCRISLVRQCAVFDYWLLPSSILAKLILRERYDYRKGCWMPR